MGQGSRSHPTATTAGLVPLVCCGTFGERLLGLEKIPQTTTLLGSQGPQETGVPFPALPQLLCDAGQLLPFSGPGATSEQWGYRLEQRF